MRLAMVAGASAGACWLFVRGAVTLDVGWGRTVRPLGPFGIDVDAPREVVFDVVAGPYLERTPKAMAGKLEVLERGTDMVLAAHRTQIRPGLEAITVETVRFSRPERIDFRLVRGPVPHVVESFVLRERNSGTRLEYEGELGADLWAVGRWWGAAVSRQWDRAVRSSLENVRAEAERRAGRPGRRGDSPG
jgi:Polyketide cyclase / dehydrase and lipid transport